MFVISKKEYYHIGCQHCKEGFMIYRQPPDMLHCPFCGINLWIGGEPEWLRSVEKAGKAESNPKELIGVW